MFSQSPKEDNMEVRTHATVSVAVSPATAFVVATDLETLPQVFLGCGPIPAIVRAEMEDGGKMQEGSVRLVHNSDGSTVYEEITALRKPHHQGYRLVRGFRPPFTYLVHHATGDWHFTSIPEGTQIHWEFRFALTTPLAYPIMVLIGRFFFQRAQQECLDRIRLLAEKQIAKRSKPSSEVCALEMLP
jgi:hypothetical protein